MPVGLEMQKESIAIQPKCNWSHQSILTMDGMLGSGLCCSKNTGKIVWYNHFRIRNPPASPNQLEVLRLKSSLSHARCFVSWSLPASSPPSSLVQLLEGSQSPSRLSCLWDFVCVMPTPNPSGACFLSCPSAPAGFIIEASLLGSPHWPLPKRPPERKLSFMLTTASSAPGLRSHLCKSEYVGRLQVVSVLIRHLLILIASCPGHSSC